MGIVFDPNFDLDFSKVLYLSDTGRRWNGHKVSIRDHPGHAADNRLRGKGKRSLSACYSFRRTTDIIKVCDRGNMPDRVMFTLHPNRWTDQPIKWMHELVVQNIKNVVKYGLNQLLDI